MNHPHRQIRHVLRQVAALSVMSGGLALLAGCTSAPESHVVSAPPPPAPQLVVNPSQPTQVVVTGTTQTAAGNTIIVMQAPPAVQVEVMPAQPTSDHKWVPGFWTWRNERYEWMAGHWELPPDQRSVWMAPRWERTSDGGYRFYEGFWK